MNKLCNILQLSYKHPAVRSFIYKRAEVSVVYASTAAGGAQKKPKESPKITLIAQNQSFSIISLEEAQKLAKRRDLHLIKVQDLDKKTQRPVYKLVTAAEVLSEELSELDATDKFVGKSSQRKHEKSLTIGSRITEHDLASRLKNISKWLSKHYEVRVLIQRNAGDSSNTENILKAIEKTIKEPEVIGKIVQKHTKDSVIKFSIMPVATPKEVDQA